MLLGGDATTGGAVGVRAEDFDDVVGEVFGCDSAQSDGDEADGSFAAAQSYEPGPGRVAARGAGRAVVDLDIYGCAARDGTGMWWVSFREWRRRPGSGQDRDFLSHCWNGEGKLLQGQAVPWLSMQSRG